MPDTYSQIYIQIVFAVQGRASLIHERNREELQKYIAGIVTNQGHKSLAIYCMPDHTHLLVNFKPDFHLSRFVGQVKSSSSRFMNDRGWFQGQFAWQSGFGAFSYSISQIDDVIRYIHRQPEHHKKRTFRDEYIDFLTRFQIAHEERYLFQFEDQ